MQKTRSSKTMLILPTSKTMLVLPILFGPLLGFQVMDLPHAAAAALFVSVVVLWLFEVLPMAVTGLLAPCLAVIYGVLSTREAFAAFGNPVLFLFVGSFLLSIAMRKHGWDKRFSYFLLSRPVAAGSPLRLTIVIALIGWGLSMWISNTAACAIVTPMCVGFFRSLAGGFRSQEQEHAFRIRTLLICAFACSIGGMATPVGSPPNLLAIQFLADYGVKISFLKWMIFALPVSLGMLVVLFAVVLLKYPVAQFSRKETDRYFGDLALELGEVSPGEKAVAGAFALTVCLWILPGFLELLWPTNPVIATVADRLPMGVVGLLGALVLFILPGGKGSRALNWEDTREIEWGTILLFGGGLTVGAILSSSGLAKAIGDVIFSGTGAGIYVIGVIVIAAGILLSEFSSNTASTTIIVPILLGSLGASDGDSATVLSIAAAFGASFGFMLPVSTPPNAIVFGTGHLPLRHMISTGLVFDVCGFLTIYGLVVVLFPYIGLL